MEFKVENLCGFLIRSKLMTAPEMLAMRQCWQADAKDSSGQAPAFIKWLITKNYITEWQAGLLSRGHIDDFFLGNYKILERIGRGRMAGVYKAVHPSGQVVAIKVLPPSRAKNAQILGRFQREARLAVKLKHPHVVRSFQVGETKGVHCFVMEYLEGDTLEEVLQRRKRLPPAEAVRLVHQALLGLQHIHEQALVHRDLKPANLMLLPTTARGDAETTLKSNLKILDIGLAREFFDENSPSDDTEHMELTGEGVLLGTPDYLAPEQARDPRNIDIRADIYSLGCTLYHLLTGQPPFPDKNILNQMIRHATETPKPLSSFNASIPEGLEQIVSWMMAKQPVQRYPTPARAAQALDAFLMVTSEPAKPAEETPQLKKYLTWLEMSEHAGDAAATLPPPDVPVALRAKPAPVPAAAPVKPSSNANIPVAAPARPVAAAKPADAPVAKKAAPQMKRKKRTGVKIDAAAVPIAAPAVPGTSPVHPVLPPAAPAAVEQFDVELVSLPATPPSKSSQSTLRDILMVGLGMALMLLLYGLWALVLWVLQMFSGD
ncbi:MAG: serine/threonine protein kinase [Gemmataceae bacterium]|nr:serine/threonine protein kinase [Gemmataceae bacterium]